MITITRKLWFCAGHRVLNHESKCSNLHGHNYILYLTASPEKENQLDNIGRIIDFSEIKKRIDPWLQEHFDHTFIIYNEDNDLIKVFDSFKQQKPIYLLPLNPTAENIGMYLLHDIFPRLMDGTGIKISKITIYETENCFAEISL